MKYNDLTPTAKQVIDFIVGDYLNTMREEGFDSWRDMSKCYRFESGDVKSEITYLVSLCEVGEMYDDGELITREECIPYKTVSAIVRSECNRRRKEELKSKARKTRKSA